jgi:hypothetical protein
MVTKTKKLQQRPIPSGEMSSDGKPSRQSLMRAVALFLDGMSRAVILSFGPSLVYRLVYGGTLKLGMDCAKVSYPLAIVVTAYLLGRGLGSSFAEKLSIPEERLPRYVARLAGAAVSLHVFTFGAGLKSVWWLVLIRFASAAIVGILCVITKESQPAEEQTEEERLEAGLNDATRRGTQRRHSYVDFVSGTAKIYMTAFMVSILSGGLLYRHATGDATFQALTGSRQFTLSPLFLVAVSLTAESILRCVFALFNPVKRHEEPTAVAPSQTLNELEFNETSTSSTLVYTTPSKSRDRTESTGSEIFMQCRDRLESTNSLNFTPRRERTETTDSLDFFDCNSVLSDMEELNLFDEEMGEASTSTSLARYVDRQCVYADGSPAYAPNGDSPDVVPQHYLKVCGGKQKKAEAMWKESQEWRRKNHVWRIHTIPNKWFGEIKKAYPHFVHGISKKGYPIIYEQPGKMNLKQMFREGCEVSDMVRHYMFLMEYISNHICTREEVRSRMSPRPPPHSAASWGTLVVMDVKGAGLSSLSGDVLAYLKNAGDINNNHYPLSLKRAFVVNSPFWLAGAWSGIKGILPESVQVDILSSHKYLAALREYVDDDQIPPEYGGSSPHKLGEHPFEQELHKLVEEAAHGEEPVENEVVPEPEREPTYSFDHNTSSWTTEVEGLSIENVVPHMNTASWRSSISRNTPSRTGQHARRRRAASTDHSNSTTLFVASMEDREDDIDDGKKRSNPGGGGGEADIFVIVSIMYALWGAIQGVIETAIPLWILIPPELGGLGYAPSRSGVAMFCSAMVLLWVMRTKASKVLSEMPSKAPMRSFRIGVGAQSVLLLLLATVPKTSGPEKRTDAVLVMTLTIIFMSCIVLSSLLGRASSTILHRIASASLAESEVKPNNWFTSRYGMERLISDGESGRLTNKINLIAEVCGVLAVAPLCSWSLAHQRPAPFDGTCCLLLSFLVTLVLYICSYSLHLNVVGEFAPHPRDGCSDLHARKCGSFLCEVATVSVSDMASLFEEANWTLTPLLGNSRSYSEVREK